MAFILLLIFFSSFMCSLSTNFCFFCSKPCDVCSVLCCAFFAFVYIYVIIRDDNALTTLYTLFVHGFRWCIRIAAKMLMFSYGCFVSFSFDYMHSRAFIWCKLSKRAHHKWYKARYTMFVFAFVLLACACVCACVCAKRGMKP